MGVLQTELVEQLTTGEIRHSTETDANLPPSVAREGGQGGYEKVCKNVRLTHLCTSVRESLPFMASALWMSSVTAPATRLEQAASCCFCSEVGFCST